MQNNLDACDDSTRRDTQRRSATCCARLQRTSLAEDTRHKFALPHRPKHDTRSHALAYSGYLLQMAGRRCRKHQQGGDSPLSSVLLHTVAQDHDLDLDWQPIYPNVAPNHTYEIEMITSNVKASCFMNSVRNQIKRTCLTQGVFFPVLDTSPFSGLRPRLKHGPHFGSQKWTQNSAKSFSTHCGC